jgi:hypothetical protein
MPTNICLLINHLQEPFGVLHVFLVQLAPGGSKKVRTRAIINPALFSGDSCAALAESPGSASALQWTRRR